MAAHPGFPARGDGHVERARAGIDDHLTGSASAALRSATDPAPPRLPLQAGYFQQPGRAPPTVGVLRAWRHPRHATPRHTVGLRRIRLRPAPAEPAADGSGIVAPA